MHFSASYSRINPCLTAGKQIRVLKCHATCRHWSITIFTTIVYGYTDCQILMWIKIVKITQANIVSKNWVRETQTRVYVRNKSCLATKHKRTDLNQIRIKEKLVMSAKIDDQNICITFGKPDYTITIWTGHWQYTFAKHKYINKLYRLALLYLDKRMLDQYFFFPWDRWASRFTRCSASAGLHCCARGRLGITAGRPGRSWVHRPTSCVSPIIHISYRRGRTHAGVDTSTWVQSTPAPLERCIQ